MKLAQHVYSCLFGTFLCNSESERLKANILKRTFSVWSLLKLRRKELKNYLYSSSSEQVGFGQSFEVKVVVSLLPQGNVRISGAAISAVQNNNIVSFAGSCVVICHQGKKISERF